MKKMKKTNNKRILIMASSMVITAASLTFAMSGTANAAAVSGWTKDGGSYQDADGRAVTNSLIVSGDGLFYADADGKQVKNQWVQVKDQAKDSQLANGWYYFGPNGRAFNYGGTTGVRKQIDGKTYAFDSSGRMETGWLDENGEQLGQEVSPIEDGVYYAGDDGALYKDQWLKYSYSDEILRDDPDSDPYGTDYSDYSEIWMYFDGNFKRVTADEGLTRQKQINGITYGFDDHGVMLPWWNPVASGSDAQKGPNGQAKYFSPDAGGGLLKDSWFWMYPTRNMNEKDFTNEEYSWWHTDHNGKLDKNRIKKINGKNYAFDKLGRMQTGFIIFNGSTGLEMHYNVDQWTSDDFKNADVIGINGAGNKLYLFGPDELNDGSMKTGKNLKVELSDGTFTFGFADNGVAYGNGNKLQKVSNTFYINGLRLDADDDFKYGVVQDAKGRCYVVDTNGRMVSGDKKVLKDGEGGWILMLHNKFMARVVGEDKPRWHTGDEGTGFYEYDSSSKDKYGDLITKYGSEPDTSNLAPEEMLYGN